MRGRRKLEKRKRLLNEVPTGRQEHWQGCREIRDLVGRAGESVEERGDGGWGLAGLFSELLSLSASAKLLNWYHILEGARPGCQQETEMEVLDLLAKGLNILAGMEVDFSSLDFLPHRPLSWQRGSCFGPHLHSPFALEGSVSAAAVLKRVCI